MLKVIHVFHDKGKEHVIDERTNECWCEPMPMIVNSVRLFIHLKPDDPYEADKYFHEVEQMIDKIRNKDFRVGD